MRTNAITDMEHQILNLKWGKFKTNTRRGNVIKEDMGKLNKIELHYLMNLVYKDVDICT
jgi:hypothetical protein